VKYAVMAMDVMYVQLSVSALCMLMVVFCCLISLWFQSNAEYLLGLC